MGKHGQAAKTRERQLEAEVAKVKEEHQAAVEAQDASEILSDLQPFIRGKRVGQDAIV